LAAAVVVLAACSDNDRSPTSPAGDPSFAQGDNGLHGKPEPHLFLRRGNARPGGGSSPNMTNHGGPVLPASKVLAIFWGSSWNSNPGDKISGLTTFFQGFGGSKFAGTNTEYSGSNGKVTTSTTFLGTRIDATSEPPARKALTTSQAVAEACAVSGNNPDPAAVYFIYTSTTAGHVSYCAWHSWGNCSNGAPIQVAYMPNIDGIAGCDPGNNLGHSQGLAALANVTAHELSEAITDPRGNAWYDASGAENADKCAWVFPSTVTLANGSTWQAQGNWSNARYTAGTGYANNSGQRGCINGNQ
jgi:hypothetical protein